MEYSGARFSHVETTRFHMEMSRPYMGMSPSRVDSSRRRIASSFRRFTSGLRRLAWSWKHVASRDSDIALCRTHVSWRRTQVSRRRTHTVMVYLRATRSSRCGASPPRVGQYSHLPSLVTHVDAPFGTLSRNLVTSPVGDTFIIVIPLDM